MRVGWEVRKLEEVCETIGGGTPSKNNSKFYNGDIPWATVRDMKNEVIIDTEHNITSEAVANSSTNIIPKDNVVIATRVGLGKICMLKQDTAINQDLRGIIPKKESLLSKDFLFQWFRSISHIIVIAGTGATVQGVKLPFIKSLLIPIPPLSEQQMIVTVLEETYLAIAKVKQKVEKNLQNVRELFESYLQSVYTNPDDEWEKIQLDQLIDIKHGFAFKSEYFSDKGNYVLLTPGNFFEEGGYRDRGEKQKYYVGDIPMNYVLDKDDLLIAMTEQAAGLLGSPVIIPESNKFLHNQRLGLIIHKDKRKVDTKFLYYLFNSKIVREQIHGSATGAKVRHTSPTKVLKLVIDLPSLDEQLRIVAKLDRLSIKTKKIEVIYEKKLAYLEELKKSILQKAFSGELTGV